MEGAFTVKRFPYCAGLAFRLQIIIANDVFAVHSHYFCGHNWRINLRFRRRIANVYTASRDGEQSPPKTN